MSDDRVIYTTLTIDLKASSYREAAPLIAAACDFVASLPEESEATLARVAQCEAIASRGPFGSFSAGVESDSDESDSNESDSDNSEPKPAKKSRKKRSKKGAKASPPAETSSDDSDAPSSKPEADVNPEDFPSDDDVRAAVQRAAERVETGEIRKVFADHGAKKVSELKPEQRASVISALDDLDSVEG